MRLILKGNELLKASGHANPHQLALASQVSSPTVARYIRTPEKVRVLDLEVLLSVLVNGLGKTHEEVLSMPLGEVFEIVE